MPDREKVIKGLQIERECVSRDCDRDCGKCDLVQDRDWLLSVYDDALALLKEQSEIVLCKDCKYGEHMCKPWSDIICNQNRATHIPDWFCADGKRKEI